MEDFSTKIKNNIEFINKFSIDNLIDILKNIAISAVTGISSNDTLYEDVIKNAKNITIKYNEFGIEKIEIVTNDNRLSWQNFKIELDCLDIIIYQQKEHSKFEETHRIPISVIRLFR